MNKSTRERIINELETEYNADNDLVAGAPRVTWADRIIFNLVIDLMEKVVKLEAEIEQLKSGSQ